MPDDALICAGALDALPLGGRKLVFVPGGATVLVLNVDGQFYALENSCPHTGASIASGPCQDHVLRCPAHGLQFNIRTGQCTASPTLRIPTYGVVIADAQLWLRPPHPDH